MGDNQQPLAGKRIAILATDGVEEVEYTQPRSAAEQAGAEVHLVSLSAGEVQAMNHDINPANRHPVDRTLDRANPADYDALVLPGGTVNPDRLRMNPAAMDFVRGFFQQAKPVAAICHGPWSLVETGMVDGRTVTSYPSLRTDIRNAGGNWVDQQVQVDNGLVTSRRPSDLPAFCAKMVEEFAEARHVRQMATA
ncbi:type 1 glutamine amidotransferase domain-containing protein [Micromonospora sp. 4G57]|uniref:Type 1 glutamine amidotransferase domain-containing protein n=1 Tax=Micromonospora sicca TaxID=2202420 RepID=A0ABU5JF14_9ACTN|nr:MULTISPECIES: type 1 glutamine amidotransferase domain-containing protein [unclassified Micromonospora]MDZ5445413.1 type 1 glutamine amidotransferase domain-containing protein [Micromonospora sp. 4G57]MDZ5491178.1 type 1 glutamine amidotransferase domain-containing protein [Micromonospora sp. 4G53]